MQSFSDLDEKAVRDKLLNVCGCYPTWTGKTKDDKSSREYVLSSDYQLLQVGPGKTWSSSLGTQTQDPIALLPPSREVSRVWDARAQCLPVQPAPLPIPPPGEGKVRLVTLPAPASA